MFIKTSRKLISIVTILSMLLSFTPLNSDVAYASQTTLNPVADIFTDNTGTYDYDDYSYPGQYATYVGSEDMMGIFNSATVLKFGLSSFSNSVDSATLRIHIISKNGTPFVSLYGSNDDSWVEGSSANTTHPTQDINILENDTNISTGTWKTFDVTNFVNSEIAGDNIATFVLKGNETGDNVFAFNSKEDVIYAPELYIEYTNDTLPPSISSLTDNEDDNIVKENDIVRITATFSEVMMNVPTITINNGGVSGSAMTNSGDGKTWTYDWTVPSGDTTATVSVAGMDMSGNVYTGNDTLILTIDNTAPIVTGITDGGYYNIDKNITFNEGTATLNGAIFNNGEIVSAEGTYILVVTDTAGNRKTINFSIDKTGPTAPTVDIGGGTYSTSQNVTLTPAVDASGTYYTLDGTNPDSTDTAYVGTINIDGFDGQTVTLKAVSYDSLGNIGNLITENYTFDKTGPTAPTVDIGGGTYSTSQNVTLTPAVDASGTYYTLDGTNPDSTDTAYVGTINIDGFDGQTVTLKAVSYDSLGNIGNLITESYTFDKSGPIINSLSPADSSVDVGTNNNLIITFSEAVNIGTGNIIIKKSLDDSTVETIDVTGLKVTGEGTNIITINPDSTLEGDIEYYVQIEAKAFNNTVGNDFAGIADKTTWNFRTKINTYNVIFKDYDGNTLKTEVVNQGGASTAPANPTREGYTFTGWDVDFSDITADLIVTAQYSTNSYTISFESNGGTTINSVKANYNTLLSEPVAPTKEDYNFTGWYEEAKLINEWDFSSDTIPAKDTTLYAKWVPLQNSITLIASPSSIEANNDFNQLFTLKISNDTVQGHVYKSDLSLGGIFSSLTIGEVDNSNTTVTAEVYGNLNSEGIGTITLNENKLKNRTSALSADIIVAPSPTYTMVYNDNGATSGTAPIDSNNYEVDDIVIIKGNTENLIKTGHSFIGWNTKADGTGTDYIVGNTFDMESSNIVLYAKWKIKEYTVIFKDHDGTVLKTETVEHGNQAGPPISPTREGHTFIGWNINFNKVTSNIIVTAQYDINSYTVKFESNGGSKVTPITAEYKSKITLPGQPTKSGYRFKGWYENQSLTKVFDFNNLIIKDITLYAKWNKIDNNNNDDTKSDKQNNETEERGTIVIVNGQEERAGEESTREEEGEKLVEVKVNSEAVIKKIEETAKNQTQENVVEIPVAAQDASKIATKLTGDIVKKMEENEFKLSIKSSDINYVIPAKEVGIESVAEKLSISKNKLQKIEVEVKIEKVREELAKKIEKNAKANDYEVVFPPVNFNVVAKAKTLSGEEKEVKVSKFKKYVQREMKIPEEVDPSKVTTGIVYNKDGTFSHVPTEVFEKDGLYYAKLNSLTNSSYSVIWNPKKLASVESHWSKKAVNDMASRLVIKNPESFMPDENITRGEFAEYVTKAIGIYRTKVAKTSKFTDVDLTNKLADAIEVATEYGIITGYTDGTFRPDEHISREEAMVMYSRAMDIVGLNEVDNDRIENYKDKDKISTWAYDCVKEVLSVGVFNGKTNDSIAPKATFTYAEAATAIRNLLIASGLINK